METKYFSDPEAQNRFTAVVEIGKKYLFETGITDPTIEIGLDELAAIEAFHFESSPSNSNNLWRQSKEDRPSSKDVSTFGNWELPGGPLEHIRLATRSAAIITLELQSHLRDNPKGTAANITHQLKELNPYHAAAAAGLHDEGREVTHLFYSNELIGSVLLKKIGVRKDLLDAMPSERVMLTPLEMSMDTTVKSLSAEAVVVRIADEFGKRFPGSNRLYLPEDYNEWDRNKWAEGYMNRQSAGRPSDQKMRENMQLHVANVPRYFSALDNWLQEVSTVSLKEITTKLNDELAPLLPKLAE